MWLRPSWDWSYAIRWEQSLSQRLACLILQRLDANWEGGNFLTLGHDTGLRETRETGISFEKFLSFHKSQAEGEELVEGLVEGQRAAVCMVGVPALLTALGPS